MNGFKLEFEPNAANKIWTQKDFEAMDVLLLPVVVV
jgi:hypothetical protein